MFKIGNTWHDGAESSLILLSHACVNTIAVYHSAMATGSAAGECRSSAHIRFQPKVKSIRPGIRPITTSLNVEERSYNEPTRAAVVPVVVRQLYAMGLEDWIPDELDSRLEDFEEVQGPGCTVPAPAAALDERLLAGSWPCCCFRVHLFGFT